MKLKVFSVKPRKISAPYSPPGSRLPARLLLGHQLAPTPISTEEKFRGEGDCLAIIATTLNVLQHLILIFYWNLNNFSSYCIAVDWQNKDKGSSVIFVKIKGLPTNMIPTLIRLTFFLLTRIFPLVGLLHKIVQRVTNMM